VQEVFDFFGVDIIEEENVFTAGFVKENEAFGTAETGLGAVWAGTESKVFTVVVGVGGAFEGLVGS